MGLDAKGAVEYHIHAQPCTHPQYIFTFMTTRNDQIHQMPPPHSMCEDVERAQTQQTRKDRPHDVHICFPAQPPGWTDR